MFMQGTSPCERAEIKLGEAHSVAKKRMLFAYYLNRINNIPALLFSFQQAGHSVTEVERKAFKETFDLYDKNGDGHITKDELREVLGKLGQKPSDAEIAEFIKVCDTDKNGTIEFKEFCRHLVTKRRMVRSIANNSHSTSFIL